MKLELQPERTLIFVVAGRQLRLALREKFRYLREIFDVHIFYRLTSPQTQNLILNVIESKYRQGVKPGQVHIFLVTGWHPTREAKQKEFLAGELPYLIYEKTKTVLPPTAEIDVSPVPKGNSESEIHHTHVAIERFLFERYFPYQKNDRA